MREFLTRPGLTSDDRDEVLAAMKDVQVNGLSVARHLRVDIYEIRATGAHATYRVLFAAEGARSQVLLAVSAFSRKTQKTPPSENLPRRAAPRRLAATGTEKLITDI
ncbi:MAG: type II toxin-antitoxin system RelE/ParE family toxin [Acidimicrobiales bacterium]